MKYEPQREALLAAIAELRVEMEGQSGCNYASQLLQRKLDTMGLSTLMRITADQLEELSPMMAGPSSATVLAMTNSMLAHPDQADSIGCSVDDYVAPEEDVLQFTHWISMVELDLLLIFAVAAKQLAVRYETREIQVGPARSQL